MKITANKTSSNKQKCEKFSKFSQTMAAFRPTCIWHLAFAHKGFNFNSLSIVFSVVTCQGIIFLELKVITSSSTLTNQTMKSMLSLKNCSHSVTHIPRSQYTAIYAFSLPLFCCNDATSFEISK